MACIIRMTSDQLLDKFIEKYDYKKFNFLLISEDVKTIEKYKNVYAIPSLIPPPTVINKFIQGGYCGDYVKKYLDYIQTPRVEAMITIMVKLAIIENANVILLCSPAENEFKYLNMICQYIENLYGIKTYSFKKYRKEPEKCEEVSEKTKKKVAKILEGKIANIKDIKPVKLTKKEAKAKFKELGKKQLISWLRSNGIKHDPKDSKKTLLKIVMKEFK